MLTLLEAKQACWKLRYDLYKGKLSAVWLGDIAHSQEIFFRFSVSKLRLFSGRELAAVRLSSVTLVHPTQAVELFGNFFSPYDSPGTLLFWCQKSLVASIYSQCDVGG